MIWISLLLTGAALGGFETRAIPLPHADAYIFLAHSDGDSILDVFVLDKRDLTAYSTAGAQPPRRMQLPEGTSAFDVADLDGDGNAEILAVIGGEVVRVDQGPGQATKLFSVETHLGEPVERPYLYPLVAFRDGVPHVLLPYENSLRLHSLQGDVVHTYEARPKEPEALGSTFWVWAVPENTEVVGGPLYMNVTWNEAVDVPLPEELKRPTVRGRESTFVSHAYKRDSDRPLSWPWMVLRTEDGVELRARYAMANRAKQETLITIEKRASDETEKRGSEEDEERPDNIGTPQPYPGVLLTGGVDAPDFNGDGYGDLLLVRTPEPASSVEAVMRAVSSATWPVIFSVHLYSKDKGRFSARPDRVLRCRAPIMWFMDLGNNNPTRNALLRDVNGDGRTDLGVSLEAKNFSIWLTGEDGFKEKPDFEHTFDEPVYQAFEDDLAGNGRCTIGLQGDKKLYLITCVP